MSFQRKCRVVLAVLASSTLSAGNILAFTIHIDPGLYPGRSNPANLGFGTGPRTVELGPGSYSVAIAPGNGFSFDVGESGSVTNVQPAPAAVGNGSTLALQTTSVTVQPGAYTGTASISGVNNTAAAGVRSFVVLSGLRDYILAVARAMTSASTWARTGTSPRSTRPRPRRGTEPP